MFIDSFIGYLKAERKYSAHTLRAYGKDLRLFEDFLCSQDESLSFEEVDADVVRAWVAHMMDEGAAPTTINRRLSALRSFYYYLCDEGAVNSVPAKELSGPKCAKRLPVFVKEEDMDRLVDGDDYGEGFAACRDKAIITFFYETGVRLSELISLNVGDIDFSAATVKVLGKRNRQRVIPFVPELRSVLSCYIDERSKVADEGEKALFVTDKGRRMNPTAVYRIVNERLKSVSSLNKRSPHVLRHSFATAMLNNNAELGAVKELLGHKRLATTEIYTHLTFEELKRFYKKAHPRAGNN